MQIGAVHVGSAVEGEHDRGAGGGFQKEKITVECSAKDGSFLQVGESAGAVRLEFKVARHRLIPPVVAEEKRREVVASAREKVMVEQGIGELLRPFSGIDEFQCAAKPFPEYDPLRHPPFRQIPAERQFTGLRGKGVGAQAAVVRKIGQRQLKGVQPLRIPEERLPLEVERQPGA